MHSPETSRCQGSIGRSVRNRFRNCSFPVTELFVTSSSVDVNIPTSIVDVYTPVHPSSLTGASHLMFEPLCFDFTGRCAQPATKSIPAITNNATRYRIGSSQNALMPRCCFTTPPQLTHSNLCNLRNLW